MKKRPKQADLGESSLRTHGRFFATGGSSGSSSSYALPESWRKTWSEAGGYASPTLRKTEESQSVAADRELSTPAKRANRKAEKKMRQVADCCRHSKSAADDSDLAPPSLSRTQSSINVSSAAYLASQKEREEAFRENANEVDSLIQTLASNIRFDSLKSNKEKNQERLAKERENAERRRAAEERAARMKEAAARDPHIKVNIRIENQRKFGMESIEDLKVPMQQVDFATDSGIEQVNMVDILLIRQRCKRCDLRSTPSVDTLIDDQARKDRLQGLDAKTGKPTAGVVPPVLNLSKSEPSFQTGRRQKCPTTVSATKQAKVHAQHEQVFMNSMLQKLTKMRTAAPESTLHNLEEIANRVQKEVAEARMCEKEERRRLDRETSKAVAFADRAVDDKLMPKLQGTPRGIIRSSRKAQAEKVVASPTARKSIKTVRECDPKVKERAKRALTIFRYAASVYVLWGMAQKKRRSISIMKDFLYTTGEWARVRLSISRLARNIVKLQRGSRQFLTLKRKRCDLMSKEWKRIENKYLSVHFKAMADKSIEDAKRAAVEKKAGPEGSIKHKMAMQNKKNDEKQNQIERMMKAAMDWTSFRIPQKERKQVISRFYMVQLKKKVTETQNLMAVVHECVQNHRETLGFLQEFGASETQANDLKLMACQATQIKSPAVFWELSEDTTLDLIAYGAHIMPYVDHWRDHPAIREIQGLDNHMYRPHVKAKGHNDFLSMMGAKPKPEKGDAKKKGRQAVAVSTADGQQLEQKAETNADVDELWRTFTPQLRDTITLNSSRPVSPASEERPSSRPGLGEQDQADWHLSSNSH
jgi:hypothetical protein